MRHQIVGVRKRRKVSQIHSPSPYEYNYVEISDNAKELVRKLNELGAEGWELVKEINGVLVLKRLRLEPLTDITWKAP